MTFTLFLNSFACDEPYCRVHGGGMFVPDVCAKRRRRHGGGGGGGGGGASNNNNNNNGTSSESAGGADHSQDCALMIAGYPGEQNKEIGLRISLRIGKAMYT